MYQDLLPEQKDAFAKIQQEYDEAKERYLKEAAKYRYFDNEYLLSSPPVNRAYYSDRTAWVMASMARLAYEPFERDKVSLALFATKLDSGGFILVEYFNVEGTQAFLAHNHIYAVLAFRGTEGDWRDIQSDIRANRKRTSEGKIHAGFFDAYGLLSGLIKNKLSEVAHLPLYVTGHSLGGALATVATQDLEKSGYKDQIAACYTFGSPRVGNADFDENIRSPVYRVVNFVDIVTFVPLFTMGFVHVGDVRYLERGQPDDIRRWRPASQRVFFFLSWFALLVPAILAHGIKNYVEKLERIALAQNKGLAMAIALEEHEKYKSKSSGS
jgi:hypothetical protein